MELQIEARIACTLFAGASGSGKTTALLRAVIVDRKLAARFFFDPEGEYKKRLQLPAATCHEELVCAAEEGFCIFDPHYLFPGKVAEAFDWFCQWSFDMASALPGRKVFIGDEVWKYCTPNAIPDSLALCIQTGRKRGLETMFATQRPNRLNEAIINEVTELLCFRLRGKNSLNTVEEMGVDRDEVKALSDGAFVAINTKSDRVLRGRVFGTSKRDHPGSRRKPGSVTPEADEENDD
jgi:hypothetical protein